MKKKTFINVLSWLIIPALSFLCCTDWDLGEEDVPDSVTLGIIGVTDTTVTLRWSKSDDVDFESYMVYYSQSDVVDTTDQIADTLFFSYDTVKTVSKLEPEKHYYFRVIVNTFRNMISASNIVDTTTLKNISSYTLKLSKPVAVSEHSISLSWEKEWTSTYNQYWIYCDTTSTVDSTDICIDTVDNITTDTVTGLKRETTYWFRVYLNRNGVPQAGSNIDSATTSDGKPKPVSVSVDRQSINDTAVTLVWSKSTDVDFKRYMVYYDTIKKIDTFTVIDTTDTNVIIVNSINDTVKTLSSLQRKKTYWFSVYVEDTSKFITASNVDSVTTDDGLPDSVTLSIISSTDTTAFLRWSKSTDKDFNSYKVYRDTNNVEDATDSLCYTSTNINDTTLFITGLTKYEQYWFVVYVTSNSGQKAGSNMVVNFPVILKHVTGSVTDSSVILVWTMSKDPGFLAYRLFRDIAPIITDELVNAVDDPFALYDLDYTDIGLDSATTYYYRIFHYATNSEGVAESRGSNEIQVNTSIKK